MKHVTDERLVQLIAVSQTMAVTGNERLELWDNMADALTEVQASRALEQAIIECRTLADFMAVQKTVQAIREYLAETQP